jgi:hypothetical protein
MIAIRLPSPPSGVAIKMPLQVGEGLELTSLEVNQPLFVFG